MPPSPSPCCWAYWLADYSQLSPSPPIAMATISCQFLGTVLPKFTPPLKEQPTSGWCRDTKAWPSHLNLGQLWRAIPAPELPANGQRPLSPQHCVTFSVYSCLAHSLTGGSPEIIQSLCLGNVAWHTPHQIPLPTDYTSDDTHSPSSTPCAVRSVYQISFVSNPFSPHPWPWFNLQAITSVWN